VYFLRWTNGRDYGELGLYRWRPGARRVDTLLKTQDLLEDCSLLRERRQLLCSHESATTPRKFVTVDLRTYELRTIYDPNRNFQKLSFGAVTPLTWRDADGIEGFGHLVAPVEPSIRRPPLIIVQYRSRGFLRGGIGDLFPIHAFATRGFAVLSFHRPDDWELQRRVRSYAELERLEYVGQRERRRILSVLLEGIDVLYERGAIDRQRVGITGLSDGGETVAFGLIHAPECFAAAAAGWTAYSPSGWYLAGPKTQPLFVGYGLGFPRGDSQAQWQQLSLALNAERVRTPLLLQVSDQELLPELEAVAALEHYRKPVELYVFPDEYHVMVQPRHRRAIYLRSLQWFDFWLQGREAGDPLDPEQYLRWRALRARVEH
jgi:dipeptidyl aminopeptidase/acylaminoacyl peptidase